MIPQITPTELAAWRADPARPQPVVVDVREPWEYAMCRIEGSRSVPLSELAQRMAELPAGDALVLVCHHGGRSQHAAQWLSQNGFTAVHNLRGGVEAWATDVEPGMTRY